MITHYVAGFYFNEDHSRVVLIEKKRPKWQAGLLNGVGGHIEPYDCDTQAAMLREFEEETGIKTSHWNWKMFARLQGTTGNHIKLIEWVVDWFWTFGPQADVTQTTDEKPGWFVLEELFSCPEVMMANLRYLLPMAINDIERRDACNLFTITETERRMGP